MDEESAKLCTFYTPFGGYKFKRMPFGIKSAPEVFQKSIQEILEGCEDTEVIIDNILIWSRDDAEHDQRLAALLDRIREKNLKLNKKKVKIGITEVPYIGHLLTRKGIKPDPEAILQIPKPERKADVHRFLGMITYLAKFIPNLSSQTEPLHQILQKDIRGSGVRRKKTARPRTL